MATSQTVFPNGAVFNGAVNATGLYSSQATITNAMVSATAGVEATKLQHQHQHCRSLANHGATPAALRQTIATVRGTTGSVVRFEAGLVTALASGSLTVDLYKNGSTILTAPIALNSSGGTGGTAFDKVAATFASTTLAQGDVLEFVLAVSTPSGGGGLFCQLTTREDAA